MATGIDSKKVYAPSPVQDATTGAVQVAPVGTECPGGARDKLTSPWEGSIGYVGSDGVTVGGLLASGNAIRDWAQNKIRVLKGQADPTMTIPAIQVDADLARLIVGEGNVETTDADTSHGNIVKMAFDGGVGPANAWCLSMADEGRRVRVFLPNAQVTNVDDISFVPTDANTYGLTLSLSADKDGHYCYFIYDDGEVEAA